MNVSLSNPLQVGSHEFQVKLQDKVFYIEAFGKSSFRTSIGGRGLVDLVFDPEFLTLVDSNNTAGFISPPKPVQFGGKTKIEPIGNFVPKVKKQLPIVPLKKTDSPSKLKRFQRTVESIIVVCFIISKFFPTWLPKLIFEETGTGFVTSSLTLLEPMSVLDNVFSTICAANFPLEATLMTKATGSWWFENIFRKVSPLDIAKISYEENVPLTVVSPTRITKQFQDVIQEISLANATWLHETKLGVSSSVPPFLTEKFEDYLVADAGLLGATADVFLHSYTISATTISHVTKQLKSSTDTVISMLAVENMKARDVIRMDNEELDEILAILGPQVVALAEGTLNVLSTMVSLGDQYARPLLERFTEALIVKAQEATILAGKATYSFVLNSPIYAVDVLYGSIDIAVETARVLNETLELIQQVEWPVNVVPLPTVEDIKYLTEGLYHSSQVVFTGMTSAVEEVRTFIPELNLVYQALNENYFKYLDYFYSTKEISKMPMSATEKLINEIKEEKISKGGLKSIASAYWMSVSTCDVEPIDLPPPPIKPDSSITGIFWKWYQGIPTESKEELESIKTYVTYRNDFLVSLTEALVTTLAGHVLGMHAQTVTVEYANRAVPKFVEDILPEYSEKIIPTFTETILPAFAEKILPVLAEKSGSILETVANVQGEIINKLLLSFL